MAYHGCPRYTGDIDLFVKVAPENARQLEGVIREFGFEDTGLTAHDFTEEHQLIQLGFPPNRIDLLTTLTGVSVSGVLGLKPRTPGARPDATFSERGQRLRGLWPVALARSLVTPAAERKDNGPNIPHGPPMCLNIPIVPLLAFASAPKSSKTPSKRSSAPPMPRGKSAKGIPSAPKPTYSANGSNNSRFSGQFRGLCAIFLAGETARGSITSIIPKG